MGDTKELKHLSLCAGYGGIDLGLKRALGSIRTVTFVEIESFAVCNLVSKMEKGLIEAAPVWTNLKTLDWKLFRGRVDLISGGFPCQPFSAAGRRQADSDPRHLFPHILRGIKICQPPVVFLENVEGILSAKLSSEGWSDPKGTSVLLHVLRELERVGYEATAGIFSAREVGAPHRRKRVFILGIKRGTEREGLEWVNELLDRNRDTSGSVYPASRGREQYLWEPPRVTMEKPSHNRSRDGGSVHEDGGGVEGGGESLSEERGTQTGYIRGADPSDDEERVGESRVTVGDSQYSRSSRPEERRGIEETSKSRGEEETLPSRQSTGAGEPSRNRDISGSSERDSREGSERPCIQEGNSNHEKPSRTDTREIQVEPEVGRDLDGTSDRVGYAKLYESFDNRTDELRMLGNGVVPDTARRAFVELWRELVNSPSFTKG